MRLPIRVRLRRDDKVTSEDAILWIGELPPEYRRGRNRKMKSRRLKFEKQEQQREERDARSDSGRGNQFDRGSRDLGALALR